MMLKDHGQRLSLLPFIVSTTIMHSKLIAYLPPKRRESEELSAQQLKRLEDVNITSKEWIDLASDIYFKWSREITKKKREEEKREAPDIFGILGIDEDHVDDWLAAQGRLLKHITQVRRQFTAPRDGWGGWLAVSPDLKGFCALYVMLLTPARLDVAVEPIARTMIQEKGIDRPEKMFDEFHKPGGEYEDCVLALSDSIKGLGLQYMTSSYVIQMCLVCIIEGKIPSTYIELLALNGVGMKIGCVSMYEAHNIVCGVPVDTHMKRSFVALRWASSNMADDVARQVAQVFAREYLGRLNETFAGLGQILQSGLDKKSTDEERKKKNDLVFMLRDVPEAWMELNIDDLLAAYKIVSVHLEEKNGVDAMVEEEVLDGSSGDDDSSDESYSHSHLVRHKRRYESDDDDEVEEDERRRRCGDGPRKRGGRASRSS